MGFPVISGSHHDSRVFDGPSKSQPVAGVSGIISTVFKSGETLDLPCLDWFLQSQGLVAISCDQSLGFTGIILSCLLNSLSWLMMTIMLFEGPGESKDSATGAGSGDEG